MRIGDTNDDGRPDIVSGMFWIECPCDPRNGSWKMHRYGDWDKKHKWGGMNKHGLGDFDGDGMLEIVVNEAENDGSGLAIFKRNPKNLNGLWKSKMIDSGLYCPHNLEATDLNEDGQLDFIVGEMNAGGWHFPLNPNPKIYAQIKQGDLQFTRIVLSEGWGVHEAEIAPKRFQGKILFYENATVQPWLGGQVTHLSSGQQKR